ncbi:uroporphyrinogen-III synthase [Schaalia dentiphila]|uniref:Uroporphyrinogen-III synthase n=1 Tax=Schaalia dentiphila ATCC 17982 TaxID=411466 RepID=A7BAV6_9ACTO|nr:MULTISPECIES: uroporphyrinogen-III synthase [Schaalia]EDN80330.1 uroporphyrinogen-III synthase [Schaalia odontolytica ATCC 17982]
MNEPHASAPHASAPHASAPLTGRRILLTRAKSDDAIARALRTAGAQVDALALTVSTPLDSAQLNAARDRLADGGFAWVVFSSWRAARAVVSGLPQARSLGTRIAAVGEATARWISDHAGVSADVTGAGSAAALLECFPAPASGARPILIPRSAAAPDTLPDGLRALGWSVEAVDAYTTTHADAADIPDDIAGNFRAGHYDAAVLTASSQARALPPLLGLPPPTTRVVTIGAPTAATASRQGIAVAAQASSPTPDAIVRALIDALDRPAHADAPEERDS